MINWPTREEWAEQRQQQPGLLPADYLSAQPKFPSSRFEDYANTAELHAVIRALQQAWRDLGRDVRGAAKDTDAKREASVKRQDINYLIKQLQGDNRASLPLCRGTRLDSEELSALVPLLGKIEARYETAREAAKAAHDQWWQNRPPADVSDDAWAAELERRRQWDEDARRRDAERAAWEAGREERERKQREEAIARGVAKRAKRREQKFREAVQALRDNALRPMSYCRCCKKDLTDPASIARGIGPECWEHVLKAVERGQAA
ncbi:hypothetical protein JQ625_28230 [Bradyrhizobium diazoefficiens]|nr:DUF6011 domain-containing protein [Bradyrhizobium diazoefficiens]MBR0778733.1 hypothetical protein [Bradyrhizobium diazoefficiens]